MRSSASSTWRSSVRSSWNRAVPDSVARASALRSLTQSRGAAPVTSSSHWYWSASGTACASFILQVCRPWASAAAGGRPSPPAGTGGRSAPFAGRRDVAQQQRLGQAGPLEEAQVQALVGAVGPGVGVLNAGDEDLRVRNQPGVAGDERNGAADADIDRGPPPCLGERRVGRP